MLQISDSHPRKSRLSRALRSHTTAPVLANDVRVKTVPARGARQLGEFFQTAGGNKQLLRNSGAWNVASRPLKLPPSSAGSLGPAADADRHISARGEREERAGGRERARRLLSAFVLRACFFFFFFYLTQKRLSPLHTQPCVCVCACPRLHASHTHAGISHRLWEAVR